MFNKPFKVTHSIRHYHNNTGEEVKIRTESGKHFTLPSKYGIIMIDGDYITHIKTKDDVSFKLYIEGTLC